MQLKTVEHEYAVIHKFVFAYDNFERNNKLWISSHILLVIISNIYSI